VRQNFISTNTSANRHISVSIAKSYGLDCRGSIPGSGKTFFSTPQRPCRFWGPPNLLPNGCRRLFSQGKAAGAWNWPLSPSCAEVENCWGIPPLRTLHGIARNSSLPLYLPNSSVVPDMLIGLLLNQNVCYSHWPLETVNNSCPPFCDLSTDSLKCPLAQYYRHRPTYL
jgi:hypothetical protein